MNNSFPRIITLLRKEKGLSQKNAAAELGVSQALLSHYEKGIRECGLDFLVKVSSFYNVSTDYLLGISPNRTGAVISAEDLSDGESELAANSSLPELDRRLIVSTVNIIYSILRDFNSKELSDEVTAYINSAIYLIFRLLYSANKDNPQGMFSIYENMYRGCIGALQSISLAKANELIEEDIKKQGIDPPIMSHDSIMQNYSTSSSALFDVISSTEEKLNTICKL